MFCNTHGTLDYCPECLESEPKQAAITSAERAVIEAAVGERSYETRAAEWGWRESEQQRLSRARAAAVDALLAAREGR